MTRRLSSQPLRAGLVRDEPPVGGDYALTLSDEAREPVRAIRAQWRAATLTTEPVDHAEVEARLADCWSLLGFRKQPKLRWCAGPLELSQRLLARPSGAPTRPGQLWGKTWDRLRSQLPEWYGRELFWSFIDRSVTDAWEAVFFDAVQGALGEQRWASLEQAIWALGHIPGHGIFTGPELIEWRFPWCPFWQYLDRHEQRPEAEPFRPVAAFAASVPWLTLGAGEIYVCERPVLSRRDEQERLHSDEGPAFGFADGLAVYAWHGLAVPAAVIEEPVTVARIEQEENVELRRVLLERYGLDRYLRERGEKPAAEDEYGRLWRLELDAGSQGGRVEPLVVVEVENATLEPDGSRRRYTLRVPPQMRSAREAVAWTFGLDEHAYGPARQT